ncbi:MAG: TIGR01777 family oxidoreductase [Planctomycetota bacterium]|nr:TIGR01777 family oxidoreductase [Planctomycetota bacterium]
MGQFLSQIRIRVPRQFAFGWHEKESAFDRLTPPWENLELVSRTGNLEAGEVQLRKKIGPIWISLLAKHSQFIQNEQFYDELSGGPFKHWEHLHQFKSVDADQTELEDQIRYQLRGGFLGNLLAGRFVQKQLGQLFAYRREVCKHEIEDHFRLDQAKSKTIAVTGSNGLIGKSICQLLSNGGHRVIPLPRLTLKSSQEQVGWIPETGQVKLPAGLSAVDCFLHLAGYGIADRRWNSSVKKLIHDSRVHTTEKLTRYLLDHEKVTESFVCASASGFYGNRGDQRLEENSEAGQGFLAETCQAWEAATHKMQASGLRTVNLRFGVVLSAKGGALGQMLLPFKMGLGGRIGSGDQVWSWISFFDALRAVHFSIVNPELSGPVNICSPDPQPQRQFARCLGNVLFRPACFPLPAFAAKIFLGEMAEFLLLSSARVFPRKLTDCGFRFVHNNLEEALRFELGRIKMHS